MGTRFLTTTYYFKDILKKTTTEYSQSSSLHGIQYIFESGGGLLLSRVLWLILSVAAAILGIVWSVEVGWISTLIKCTDRAWRMPVCRSYLLNTNCLSFVAKRPTGFVFLLLLTTSGGRTYIERSRNTKPVDLKTTKSSSLC